jgi:hypothetical protein
MLLRFQKAALRGNYETVKPSLFNAFEIFDIRDLEQCLGEDHHKISIWIATAGFEIGFKARGGTAGTEATSTVSRRKTSCASSRTHPQEINLGKVDQVWFLDLVLSRGREVPEAKSSRVEEADENAAAA